MTDLSFRAVLEYWFGDALTAPPEGLAAHFERWFRSGGGVDDEIRERFGSWVEKAAAGKLDVWHASAQGTVALIILLDQFPRNIWRGQSRAFAQDAAALNWCRDLIATGADRSLHELQRVFTYMPHQHAEDLSVQEAGVLAYEQLLADAREPYRGAVGGALEHAREHRDIIERFGRFPHRNAALGRVSTSAEDEYLAGGGKRFGQ